MAFDRPPRDFTDAAWRQTATPARVESVIRNGVPGTAMPPWRVLGDEAVRDLAAFVLSVGQAR